MNNNVILSMNKSVILCTMKYVTVLSQLMVEMEEVPVDLEALPVVTLVVHNLDMELLLPLLAVKSQDKSAEMFPNRSPDKSAPTSQDSNATMFQGSNATMSQDKSATTFQDRPAKMFQDKSATMFLASSVNRFQGELKKRFARTFPVK